MITSPNIVTGFDAATLRDVVDLAAAGARLDELGALRSLSALNEKVTLLRLVGRLDEAWLIASEAVRQARFTGDREQAAASRIRRAQVQQFQGKLDEAVVELTHCVQECEAHEWSAVAAFARENRGKVYFDQGNLDAALVDLTAAVFLRENDGASADVLEGALAAVVSVEALIAERARPSAI
ncbi:hypothetical protein [Cryobacterium frigoriphilum]|uniref:hypothetical protein n=1 Tax=Cryobacterium frigoriphilum TaxID=1259150 RepID=UPI001F546C6A|nr:hypothetical protein [Cryobacterium frigoriphilum]